MKRSIYLLKIFSPICFLLVMIPSGEKFGTLPMFVWLVVSMLGLEEFNTFIYSILVLAAILYLLITAKKQSKFSDYISLIALLVLFVPTAIVFKRILIHPDFVTISSVLISIVISVWLIVLIVLRLKIPSSRGSSGRFGN